jgi:hypothetical protein
LALPCSFPNPPPLRTLLEHGPGSLRVAAIALDRIKPIHESFVELLEERYDTILTPATPGAAPIEKKGSGVFSRQSNPDCC